MYIYLCKIQQRKILCNHNTRTGSHAAYHLSHISSQQHSWSCDNRNQRDAGKTFHAQASLWPPRTGLQYKTWSNKYVIINICVTHVLIAKVWQIWIVLIHQNFINFSALFCTEFEVENFISHGISNHPYSKSAD